MDKFALLLRYLTFLIKSGNEHHIHSPFIYDLYTQAIKPQKQFYFFKTAENLRKELHASSQVIKVTDLGAGSKIHKTNMRKVSSIAKTAEKSVRLSQLLFQLIEYLKPSVIFDLGTSLGITTIYEASASSASTVFTFEGCPETADIALRNFQKMKMHNISLIKGNIDDTLPAALKKIDRLDFVFFDANHRYEPTMRYFHLCLGKAHEESCFVMDDIHWSEEMERAWKEIQSHSEVTVSIDLFYMGIVFFRKKQPKEHFVLRS